MSISFKCTRCGSTHTCAHMKKVRHVQDMDGIKEQDRYSTYCEKCKRYFTAVDTESLNPPGCKYSYRVLEEIKNTQDKYNSLLEMCVDLNAKGVKIASSTFYKLVYKYGLITNPKLKKRRSCVKNSKRYRNGRHSTPSNK